MIAFKDKAGNDHEVDNMSFEESEHGSIKCMFLGIDAFGGKIQLSQGKGFTLSEAFLRALDTLQPED
jgi:hypothetical protein